MWYYRSVLPCEYQLRVLLVVVGYQVEGGGRGAGVGVGAGVGGDCAGDKGIFITDSGDKEFDVRGLVQMVL